MTEIDFDDFSKVEIRVGTIVEVQDNPEARQPAYKIWVDFGLPVGTKKTSAQVVVNYDKQELLGRQVAAVTNFPPKQIGKFMSEILVLGFPNANGEVCLIGPDKKVPDGGRLY